MAARKGQGDPEVVKRSVGPETPEREVEARMGQYLAAFGSGAADAHVPRAVVDLLRYRYIPSIRDVVANRPDAWDTEGPHVLDLMRGVGRLAASLALARGDIAIAPWDAWQAAGRVETREAMVFGPTQNCPYAEPAVPSWCTPPIETKRARRR